MRGEEGENLSCLHSKNITTVEPLPKKNNSCACKKTLFSVPLVFGLGKFHCINYPTSMRKKTVGFYHSVLETRRK